MSDRWHVYDFKSGPVPSPNPKFYGEPFVWTQEQADYEQQQRPGRYTFKALQGTPRSGTPRK